MNFDKILRATKKFEKIARINKVSQQQLTEGAVANVVLDTLKEMGELTEWEAQPEIQVWRMPDDPPSHHVQPKYNIGVSVGMVFPATVDATLQGRLHQAFDPYHEIYSFHISRAGE